MNRQQRRQSGRQGDAAAGDGGGDEPDEDGALVGASLADAAVGADEAPATTVRARGGRGPATAPVRHRVAPRQFLHEVNVELRKVAWPSRAETVNYSTVVFVTLAILMALIFALDLAFTHLAGFLFNP